jgi:Tol biopolymer transport system component/DNA-binding winged helix-turn-helix (wHTH) protein
MESPGKSIRPQSRGGQTVAFGPFELDVATIELRKHSYKAKLPPQLGQILIALVQQPGEVVTREDLRIRLWPGFSSGDFEHGINAAINKLRQALGDAASEPRYIETLPGRGYRFIAPLHPVTAGVLELVAAAPIESAPAPWRSRRLSLWIWATGALLTLVILGSAIALRPSPAAPRKATQFQIAPPKGYYLEGGGVRSSFALSPDGERIAFTAKDTSGAFRLFLRDFSASESRPVADGEGAYSAVWTPDGQGLLFTAKGKLRRIEANETVSHVVAEASPYFSSAIPFGAGRLLVSNHLNSGVISLSGGPPQPIDRLYSWAQTLPGGRDFLYTVNDPQLASRRARIAAVGGTEQGVEVVQADSRVQYTGSLRSDGGYLVFLRAGTLLAQPFDLAARRVSGEPKAIARHVPSFGSTGAADFSVSRRGVLAYQSYNTRSQFIWVDRTGKRLSAASTGEMNSSYLRLSPDGRSLAAAVFDVERGVTDIWIYDPVTGAGRKAIFGPGISHAPVWSPDSRRLVYLFDRSWPRLALSSLDGIADSEPMPNTGVMAPTDWSPDGRFILYNNSALPAITNGFPSDVFAIDMARGRRVIHLLKTPFFENNAVFSPDGKWLAFLSDESGKAEVYMQALDRSHDTLDVIGERFQISSQGAQCLRWRKDGKELYYLSNDGQVSAIPLSYKAGRVHAGHPEPLFTIEAEARSTIHSVASFDVSADGRRFVIPSMIPGEISALVVMQDWESLVGK